MTKTEKQRLSSFRQRARKVAGEAKRLAVAVDKELKRQMKKS